MTELFANKYRIPSARLQSWDYGNEAMYFVTICTKYKECYFGEIVCKDDRDRPPMPICELTPTIIGKVAYDEWYKTIELRPDMNLELAEFVVMPNHIHGIIMIGQNKYNLQRHTMNQNNYNTSSSDLSYGKGDARHSVSTTSQNKFEPQSKNLASIIRGYKSAVTTFAHNNNIPFDWQPRFYDRIIRSQDEYIKIVNYIINNPANWQKDKLYK
jgi:putative transposase